MPYSQKWWENICLYVCVCVCYAHWMAVDVLTQVHYGDAPSLWEEITSPLREVQSSHYGAHIHVSFVIFWGKMHHNVLNLMVNMWVKCKTEQIVVRIWESSSSWSPWSLCNLPKVTEKHLFEPVCVCVLPFLCLRQRAHSCNYLGSSCTSARRLSLHIVPYNAAPAQMSRFLSWLIVSN